MPKPEEYTRIEAHEVSIEQAREVKEKHGLTWNEFFEEASRALDERLTPADGGGEAAHADSSAEADSYGSWVE